MKIYSDTFTNDEITGLTVFYRSPLGQARIEKMPLVMSKTMELVYARMMIVPPKMQERVREMIATQGQPAK